MSIMLTCEIPALDVNVVGKRVIALVRKKGKLLLVSFDENLGDERVLEEFKGTDGFILEASEDSWLVAIDNELIFTEGRRKEVVLKTNSPQNFFWHSARGKDKIYVQEYGIPPTYIYVSNNYRDWKPLKNNLQIDKTSKHFHNVSYDQYRDWLIVTLGDGNWVRVCVFDEKHNWRPLYKGPWQFLPVVPQESRIVFGMDSGIVKGGIGIYYLDEDDWDFTFLRWNNADIGFIQMSDLAYLDNGFWVAMLGSPQAIMASENLEKWYTVHIKGYEKFNHHMRVSKGKRDVACSTGKNLYLLRKSELKNFTKKRPAIKYHDSYLNRLRGLGFCLKKKLPPT